MRVDGFPAAPACTPYCSKTICEGVRGLRYSQHDSFNKNLETATRGFAFGDLVDQQVAKGALSGKISY